MGSDTENQASTVDQSNRLEQFTIRSRLFQIMMSSGDMMQGTYASLYAVARGSTGLIQGAIVSVRELGTAILQPLWGHLSDLIGRRQFVFLGLLIQAIAWGILMPLATTPLLILLVIIVQTTLGTMVIPTWNGWLGDFTSRSTRGRFLGRLGLLGSWSSLVALIAVSSYMQFVDVSREFVSTYFIALRATGIFYLLAAISALILPQVDRYDQSQQILRKERAKQEKLIKKPRVTFIQRIRNLKPEFKRLLLAEGIFRLAWAAAWPIFPYATLSATEGWLEIAILQLVFGFTVGISQLFGGRLSDKFGRRRVIVWSRIVLVSTPLLFALGVLYNDPTYLFISNFLTGLLIGGSTIAINSLILDIAPEGNESSYFSLYMLTVGIISFIGSMITGVVLNILIPDTAPGTELLVIMFVFVAAFRLFAWFFLFMLPETVDI